MTVCKGSAVEKSLETVQIWLVCEERRGGGGADGPGGRVQGTAK